MKKIALIILTLFMITVITFILFEEYQINKFYIIDK